MTPASKEQVTEILSNISFEDIDVLGMGIISSIIANDGDVGLLINTNKNFNREKAERLKNICEKKLLAEPNVKKVTVVITNSESSEAVHEKPDSKNKQVPKPPTPKKIKGIEKIIAVASGKGGVGKSTISANLALALQQKGFKVGLVDADIHGPSVARIMGLKDEEPEVKDNKIIPKISNGVKCMTMGVLLSENAPVVWRGPMVTKALSQLMLAANWGELDYLIVDMPPGTGDIQLSLLQNYKVDGVVLVSTPQQVALADVKKATSMFYKMNIKILGVIENMAYFQAEGSDEKINIFGNGNVKKYCEETGIKHLFEVPISPEISAICDSGLKGKNRVSEIILEHLQYIIS